MDARPDIVKAAMWGVSHHAFATYEERRPMVTPFHPFATPFTSDCSEWVTACYKWAGCPDPNGLAYDGSGYTGTLLSHGTPILELQAAAGDVIVYGAYPGVHTAIIVEGGPDPLTVSMGEQGDPNLVRVSQDGRLPRTYLRFDTTKPTPNPPKGSAAAKVGLKSRPSGSPPIIKPGQREPKDWIVYLRRLLNAGGVSNLPVGIGGYGRLTQNAVIRWKRKAGLHQDAIVGQGMWWSLGVAQ